MATTVTASGKNVQASALAAVCAYTALLNASGVECSSSGYARQATSWGAATGGVCTMSGTLSFTVESFTVAKTACYDLVTGGTKYTEDDVAEAVYTTSATYTLDSQTVTAADPA